MDYPLQLANSYSISFMFIIQFSSSSAFPAMSLGFSIFGEILAYVTVFKPNHRRSHIPSSWINSVKSTS